MFARFLSLVDLGVTVEKIVIADLDNVWTKKANQIAENFESQ